MACTLERGQGRSMSVYPRVFGRELPCSVLELLDIPHLSVSPTQLDQLHAQATLGLADASSRHRLGLAHLASGRAGLARKWLDTALAADPTVAAHHLALAAALEMVAQHDQAAAQIDRVINDPALSEQVQPALP